MAKDYCPKHELVDLGTAHYQFFHIVPAGMTIDQVTAPNYWRAIWQTFTHKRFCTVDLVADDNSWEARVRVLAAVDGVVKMRVLYHVEADRKPGRAFVLPDGYKIEHMEGKGWRAVDPVGSVVAQGEALKDDAIRAAALHAKKAA